jgi:hypothetical protein
MTFALVPKQLSGVVVVDNVRRARGSKDRASEPIDELLL